MSKDDEQIKRVVDDSRKEAIKKDDNNEDLLHYPYGDQFRYDDVLVEVRDNLSIYSGLVDDDLSFFLIKAISFKGINEELHSADLKWTQFHSFEEVFRKQPVEIANKFKELYQIVIDQFSQSLLHVTLRSLRKSAHKLNKDEKKQATSGLIIDAVFLLLLFVPGGANIAIPSLVMSGIGSLRLRSKRVRGITKFKKEKDELKGLLKDKTESYVAKAHEYRKRLQEIDRIDNRRGIDGIINKKGGKKLRDKLKKRYKKKRDDLEEAQSKEAPDLRREMDEIFNIKNKIYRVDISINDLKTIKPEEINFQSNLFINALFDDRSSFIYKSIFQHLDTKRGSNKKDISSEKDLGQLIIDKMTDEKKKVLNEIDRFYNEYMVIKNKEFLSISNDANQAQSAHLVAKYFSIQDEEFFRDLYAMFYAPLAHEYSIFKNTLENLFWSEFLLRKAQSKSISTAFYIFSNYKLIYSIRHEGKSLFNHLLNEMRYYITGKITLEKVDEKTVVYYKASDVYEKSSLIALSSNGILARYDRLFFKYIQDKKSHIRIYGLLKSYLTFLFSPADESLLSSDHFFYKDNLHFLYMHYEFFLKIHGNLSKNYETYLLKLRDNLTGKCKFNKIELVNQLMRNERFISEKGTILLAISIDSLAKNKYILGE